MGADRPRHGGLRGGGRRAHQLGRRDLAPEQGEVALPRLGWMAVMLGTRDLTGTRRLLLAMRWDRGNGDPGASVAHRWIHVKAGRTLVHGEVLAEAHGPDELHQGPPSGTVGGCSLDGHDVRVPWLDVGRIGDQPDDLVSYRAPGC